MTTVLAVTFAWSFVVAAFVLKKLFGCKHKWELVDKTQLPSKIEIMKANWNPSKMTMPELLDVARVKILIVIRCSGCGAAKVIRESND
jgi:hypothetical protein